MVVLETDRMQEIVKGLTTVSDKMRALEDAGFTRADIARFLDKRYQHVRNVLTSPRPTRSRVSREGSAPEATTAKLRAKIQIGAGGRVVIPAEMRAAMGVAEGDTVLAHVVEGEMRLLSRQSAIRKAQNIVRRFVPEGVSLVDELIEERRAEAREEGV